MQIQSTLTPDGRSIVERLMEIYAVTTLPQLALSMLENLSTVKGWKQRGSVPLEHCVRAAQQKKCSLDWLVLGEGPVRKETFEEVRNASGQTAREEPALYGDVLHFRRGGQDVNFVLVPRYSAPASLSLAEDAAGQVESVIGEIAFEAGWMREHFGRAGAGFALLDVSGNSMEPTLWDGETILVDLHLREVASGGVYVLRDGEELLVKRLQRLIGGGVGVVSDNSNFRSQEVEDPAQLNVIGRVVWPKVR
ncbi:MAG: S24 family peptidase [Rubrivivax sp.]|nr:S24 family peptidase [Rubrivivax sp.]MDP3610927.1 S24 family peptidase [Rubrivivax sp.]